MKNKFIAWTIFVAINGGLLFGLNMAGISGAGTAEIPQLNRQNAYKKVLEELGIDVIYYESPCTAHEWHTWRRFLYEFAPLLFR